MRFNYEAQKSEMASAFGMGLFACRCVASWLVLSVGLVQLTISGQHFVDENAECPPVDFLSVTFRLDDLRRQILRSAAQSPGSIAEKAARTHTQTIKQHNWQQRKESRNTNCEMRDAQSAIIRMLTGLCRTAIAIFFANRRQNKRLRIQLTLSFSQIQSP